MLTMPFSWVFRWLMLKFGVMWIRQSIGLNEVSPWKRSTETEKFCLKNAWRPRPKNSALSGRCAAHVAGHGQLAHVEQGIAFSKDHQKIVLSEDGIVALEHVLSIGVVDRALFKSRIFGKADAPAVLSWNFVRALSARAVSIREAPA